MSRSQLIEYSELTRKVDATKIVREQAARAHTRALHEDDQALEILLREEKAVLGIPEEMHPLSLFEARKRRASTELRVAETRSECAVSKKAHQDAVRALADISATVQNQVTGHSHPVPVSTA